MVLKRILFSIVIFALVLSGSQSVRARESDYAPLNAALPNFWKSFGSTTPFYAENVYAIAMDSKNNVYVGGNFATVYDSAGIAVPNTVNIAKWDGSKWHALGRGTESTVFSMVVDSHDNLYVGGGFWHVFDAGGSIFNYTQRIAKWNGSAWSPLGQGADFLCML